MAIFTNQATLSYNNNVTNSNTVTGELREVLSVTKNSVSETYKFGDIVTYVVSIINSGTTPFTALNISDNLGSYDFEGINIVPLTYIENSINYYVNGILQTVPNVTQGPPLQINNVNVPAGGNAILIYQARVNNFAPLDTNGSINNQVTVSGTGITNNLTANETITPENTAILTISKAISPSSIVENEPLTYTFTIQNYGNKAADITDNALITDTFNPILNSISVTFNEASWIEPTNYTYNTATGLFQTVAGQITVPAATYIQDSTTGNWIVQPGISTLKVTGII